MSRKSKPNWLKYVFAIIPAILFFAVMVSVLMWRGGRFSNMNMFNDISTYPEYTCAMFIIQKNADAIELVGSSIEGGTDFEPAIEILGSERKVSFRVSVTGSKSTEKLVVISHRSSFQSNFLMYLEKDGKNVTLHSGSFPCVEEAKEEQGVEKSNH